MKYCPQCNRQYTEPWITFCSDDGTMLIEELTPPVDPNWNPYVRETQFKTPSEMETQWLPREPSVPPAWVPPHERPPMRPGQPGAWQPPPPPPRPVGQQSQTLAVASMITGLVGLAIGCFGPVPGIIAVVMGWMALQQIKKSPETTGGKPMAIIGLITGGLAIFIYGLLFLWFLAAGVLGNL